MGRVEVDKIDRLSVVERGFVACKHDFRLSQQVSDLHQIRLVEERWHLGILAKWYVKFSLLVYAIESIVAGFVQEYEPSSSLVVLKVFRIQSTDPFVKPSGNSLLLIPAELCEQRIQVVPNRGVSLEYL